MPEIQKLTPTRALCPHNWDDRCGPGFREYGGLCPMHWLECDESERADMLAAMSPDRPIERHEHAGDHHQHIYNYPHKAAVLLFGVLCGLAGGAAAVAALAWRGWF